MYHEKQVLEKNGKGVGRLGDSSGHNVGLALSEGEREGKKKKGWIEVSQVAIQA